MKMVVRLCIRTKNIWIFDLYRTTNLVIIQNVIKKKRCYHAHLLM